ncbi:MAG: magnesium chelatase domain-containing protein [Adlercreutzia equolifaciens]
MGATVRGVEVVPVRVEVVVSGGLPGMAIVGMPDAAIQEARERVRAALRAAGFSMPGEKIVVNLAPSHLRKTGSGFDLPIALGILAATGQIDPAWARDALYVGELSLDGRVRPVAGTLACAICARRLGLDFVCRRQRSGALRRRAAARYDVAGPGGP